MPPKERLDKLISKAAGLSRQDAKKQITSGKVTVAGAVCKNPSEKFEENSALAIDGQEVTHIPFVYIMVNKPKGLLCVSRDPKRETVVDLVKSVYPRRNLFPAGRLDKDSEGFVLLTDDGGFAHEMLSPKKHVGKVYEVTLDTPFTSEMMNAFKEGIMLADGTMCKPAIVTSTEDPYICVVTLQEGKYHQIKRMFGVLGAGVNCLVRVQIGGLLLDNTLQIGAFRKITQQEKAQILQK